STSLSTSVSESTSLSTSVSDSASTSASTSLSTSVSESTSLSTSVSDSASTSTSVSESKNTHLLNELPDTGEANRGLISAATAFLAGLGLLKRKKKEKDSKKEY
ncbi:LPXTG cell wall anchor domain-containing protein, partial [Macrococcoides bohemicum]|uniref:LPXTG cell wall anchor domain-containing protein n=1 Tax=Macrococcoides bohemicum TaxID=1903056 RepID=UPI00289DA231